MYIQQLQCTQVTSQNHYKVAYCIGFH